MKRSVRRLVLRREREPRAGRFRLATGPRAAVLRRERSRVQRASAHADEVGAWTPAVRVRAVERRRSRIAYDPEIASPPVAAPVLRRAATVAPTRAEPAERPSAPELGSGASVAPRVAVAAIVFDARGRVLLVRRGQPPAAGRWSVPGGKLERGETLAQGVSREVREETGLRVEVGPLACVVERMGADHHYVILDYLARVTGGALAAGSDAGAAQFFDEAALASLPLTEGLRDVLARARASYAAWSAR